jgi:hypothetical protein
MGQTRSYQNTAKSQGQIIDKEIKEKSDKLILKRKAPFLIFENSLTGL